ncbi:putative leucine-rich repeat receptor-like serine/threonine-protein kinase At2g24130 [Aristolochia californica]|uniref:putative leucine-rich repeat receptor-like serine/threonine-protein kinase At2g24130 n=1 Tax=Aristolochia californica TaxID=171875 RepID=UPI0035D68C76
MGRRKIIIFLLILSILYEPCSSQRYRHHHPTIATDKAALLAFRHTVTWDALGKLQNWRASSDVCSFAGVTCNRRHHRVVKLELNDSGIGGLLSPFLANLTGLKILNLSNNALYGSIPSELGSLRRLLDLKLDGNSLRGSIPVSLGVLPRLMYLDFKSNRLTGPLPTSILYNCSILGYIDLSSNVLSGEIPAQEGEHFTSLMFLNLYSNRLSGTIPASFSKFSYLEWLDVENNSLSGELPSHVLAKLQSLRFLHLTGNHFSSHDGNSNLEPFFSALSNCTRLEEIELGGNGLGGELPSSIGLLGVNLSNINLEENRIFGSVPPNIKNLSNLTLLNLSSNLLNGTIPSEISQLPRLERLVLSANMLHGEIPQVIGRITSLGLLDLSRNQLSGRIPASLGDLKRLKELLLQENQLSGEIPSSLGRCVSLTKLDLSYNILTGKIPEEISQLESLGIYLNLSHNILQGFLPLGIGKLELVEAIDLSANNLSGNISPQLESCLRLRLINLSHNALQGMLPKSLGRLRSLEALDVSNNSLSGEIPSSLNDCTSLKELNLSFNNFNGSIPMGLISSFTNLSFIGNKHICGRVPGVPNCRRRGRRVHASKLVIIIVSVVSASLLLLILGCLLGYRKIKWKIFTKKDSKWNKSTPELKLNFPRITYQELADATEGFDQGRLIGSGSFGHVYKGSLKDGTIVAVKVLHLQTKNSTKSFNRECEVLKRIRHRNLMRIITACSLQDFKALVLPYMANGSLESHLYPAAIGSDFSYLSLVQRVNICSDIAEGMAYLHHHSPVRVIHCDLKPSNVLLNDDMTALVSDFGIARLVMNVGGNGGADSMGNSTANLLCGSIGYIAPEYAFGSSTTTKGDVYSFGVLVLEMVTRKRPTDEMFVGGLSLHLWVKSHYRGRVEKLIDPLLIMDVKVESPEDRKMWEVALGELIELGLLCTQEAPSVRPTMLDVADDLDRLKKYLAGDASATFASSLGISSSTVIGGD